MLTPKQSRDYEKASVEAAYPCWECGGAVLQRSAVICYECRLKRFDALTQQHHDAINSINEQRRELINQHETSSNKVRG